MGDMLSQGELDALLGSNESKTEKKYSLDEQDMKLLEQLGEESMEVIANTLQILLNQSIFIGEPNLSVVLLSTMKRDFDSPHIGALIEFTAGIVGSNILVLTYADAKSIADLMMGGDGMPEDTELSELDKSAIGEAMNQAVGNVSNLFYKVLGEKVDINTPKIFAIDPDDPDISDEATFLKNIGFDRDEEVLALEFDFKVGEVVNSKIISVMDLEFAVKLKDRYKPIVQEKKQIEKAIEAIDRTEQFSDEYVENKAKSSGNRPMENVNEYKSNNKNRDVNVKNVEFQNFDPTEIIQQKENIDIIMDVPLEVTVEMGRTSKKIEEILEFSPGTIIELNKLAGDPIDIVVNGKFVAKGEVVVIDENYGIRITDIINKSKRI